MKGESGYTAIEVVITASIVVMSLFAGITIVGGVVEVNRARSAAEQVASAFQLARQYAVSNGATYTVTLTSNPSTIAISCTATCPPSPPSEPTTAIINDATTSVPPPITFGPMGTSSSGIVTVTHPRAPNWQVRVTGAGGVRTCSPTCP